MEDKTLHPPGMRDISHKVPSLRIATAKATVSMQPETIIAVRENRAPKGDPLSVARVAATQAAKNTPQFIPYCHPIPIDHVLVEFELREKEIDCIVTVKSIYKTGVEVEAMSSASIGALNLYDLLKPIDDEISIKNIQLLSKIGGKSDWISDDVFSSAIVTVSDRCFKKEQSDTSGSILKTGLERQGGRIISQTIIPDEIEQIRNTVLEITKSNPPQLIMLTGGTGIAPRDVTFEAVIEILDLRLPGVEEHFRKYSQERIPTAMLSRSLAGVIGQTVILSIPGSPKACQEAIDCLFPALTHTFSMLKGSGHE